ncbi:MAG: ScpA family protein [Actinomycetota bacterium]|nr:ScpA family protein [Actinomycetota bacterium]
MSYQVSTPVYEGPFDLLLQLVTTDRVDLWEVSLSLIVDDFLEHCARSAKVDLELTSEFAVIASLLVGLKCRRLLPSVDDAGDDDLLSAPERDALLARLLECATFRDTGAVLGAMSDRAAASVSRSAPPGEAAAAFVPNPLEGVSAEQLAAAYGRVMSAPAPPRVDTAHMPPPVPSVATTAMSIASRLRHVGSARFSDLLAATDGSEAAQWEASRIEVVVAFLAILELYKNGLIELDQGGSFADIWCSWAGGDAVVDLRGMRF